MRGLDSRRTGRPYRRLLHLGLAQGRLFPSSNGTERLLWHPARYEGFESSDNVIYVGAAPNQHVVPLVRHMLDHISTDVFCIGSNYIWTWEMNRVIREIVTSAGGRVLAERLLELGETTVDHIVTEVIDRRPPVVFNTLVGESSYAFMRALHAAATHAGLLDPDAELQPVRARTQADRIGGLGRLRHLFRHISKASKGLKIAAFVARWKARHGATAASPSTDNRPTSASCCWPGHPPRRARRMSARCGALRQITATIPRRDRSGSIRTIITASLRRDWHAPAPGCPVQYLLGGGRPRSVPIPYLSNLDLTAIGTGPEKSNDALAKRSTHLRIVK
jgi:branched-chain amino acid transport system substrate-binding protein